MRREYRANPSSASLSNPEKRAELSNIDPSKCMALIVTKIPSRRAKFDPLKTLKRRRKIMEHVSKPEKCDVRHFRSDKTYPFQGYGQGASNGLDFEPGRFFNV